jgi:phage-related protein
LAAVRVVWYREGRRVPLRIWLDSLDRRARSRCLERLALLESLGHTLRRPIAGHLGGEIYELRARHNRLRLRVLYFFMGRDVAVISHGFIKKTGPVPERELAMAWRHRAAYRAQPESHSFSPGE